ncbi:clarin-3-like isoform X1 [Antedon mediterranea]|uniref:clarin-3-like isoform X1 n=1 Tax=Antedon mediterranea TaxID=105859 RepID=UPI003AF6154E
MCLRYKTFFFLNFVTCLCIVILLCTSIGTPHWIEAESKRNSSLGGGVSNVISTNDDEPGPNRGFIHFGVVRGCKIFNYGFGARDYKCFKVSEEHADLYPTGLLIVVIVFMVIAAIFAMVATIFGMVNAITRPIEAIHGPKGLFLWNGFGAIFSGISLFMYVGLYYTTFEGKEVLNAEDTSQPNYFTTDSANYGYSFWLLVTTFGLFCVNLILLIIAHKMNDPNFRWRRRAQEISTIQTTELAQSIMY